MQKFNYKIAHKYRESEIHGAVLSNHFEVCTLILTTFLLGPVPTTNPFYLRPAVRDRMFEGTGKYFCLFIQPRYAEMTLTRKVASCLISNIAMSHGGLIIGMFEGIGKSIYPATLRWDDLDPEGGLLSDIQHRHVTRRPHHWNVWGHR